MRAPKPEKRLKYGGASSYSTVSGRDAKRPHTAKSLCG
jgi:hypothetical protein